MDVKYYTKYLKYKNKYTLLKKQMGGCDVCHDAECEHGEKCGAIQIRVVNWSGEELYIISVLPTDNTNKLFEAIQKQGVPINKQRLSLEDSRNIEQDQLISFYEITDRSTIVLTIVDGTSTQTQFYFRDAPETHVEGNLSELETSFANRKSRLIKVIVGSETTTLGDSTFSNCINLVHAEIPASVTSMGKHTFFNCRSLTHVVLSENLTKLDDSTFSFCVSLNHVVIPSSFTTIANYVFYNCMSLERLDIPSSVTSIGVDVFKGCTSLNTVVIHSDGDIVFDRHLGTFSDTIRFYTNSPTVTAYLSQQYSPAIVYPKEAAPPVAGGF